MENQKEYIRRKWKLALQELAADNSHHSDLIEQALAEYDSKERYYHNITHIYNMLHESEATSTNPLLTLAIIYHDIVYDATSKNNEERSAEYFSKQAKLLKLEAEKIKEIEQLILCTKNHQPSKSLEENIIDLDLSTLSQTKTRYNLYTQQIRQEYHMYPDEEYIKGRAKAIRHFLNHPQIYFTPSFLKREDDARKNLKYELQNLES